jgi:mRNA interferase MazF
VVTARLPGDKARPFVVVRSDLFAEMPYASVLPITSDLVGDISVRIGLAPGPENGLLTASQVMVDWPQTIRLTTMGEVIGRLNAETMSAITRQLAVVLGIGGTRGPSRSRRHGTPP